MERPSADDDNPREATFALLPDEEAASIADHDNDRDGEDDSMIRHAEGDDEKRNVELEYETPNTVKFLWLGTYFFFSLMLTLYNKLVLGSVSAITAWKLQTPSITTC